jgi:hypothetical protein
LEVKIAELNGKTIHIDQARMNDIKQIRFLNEYGTAEIEVIINWTN